MKPTHYITMNLPIDPRITKVDMDRVQQQFPNVVVLLTDGKPWVSNNDTSLMIMVARYLTLDLNTRFKRLAA